MVNIAEQFINLSKYLIEILIQDTYEKLKVHSTQFNHDFSVIITTKSNKGLKADQDPLQCKERREWRERPKNEKKIL
jgi:hypothetical protein